MRTVAPLLLLVACGPTVRISPFPDGTPYRTVSWRDGHLHGAIDVRYEGGALDHEGLHLHGLRNGTWEYHWPEGGLRSRQVFDGGLRHGRFGEWWRGGQKRFEGEWVEGDKHGAWEFWDEAGVLHAREEWTHGTRTSLERF